MSGIHGEIKFKVICPLCGRTVILAMESNNQFTGYCDNCEHKVKLTDNPMHIKEGIIDIVLR